jgi:hypothetical protein
MSETQILIAWSSEEEGSTTAVLWMCHNLSTLLLISHIFSYYIVSCAPWDNLLGLDQFSQVSISFVAIIQQADILSFIGPFYNSLSQIANGLAEAVPKIIAPLILLGIGLLVGRFTHGKALEENSRAGG